MEEELVSGACDGSIIIWQNIDGVWKSAHTLQGHTESVTCVYPMALPDGSCIIASSSGDGFVIIWKRVGTPPLPSSSSSFSLPASHILRITTDPLRLSFSYLLTTVERGSSWEIVQKIKSG